MEDPGRKTSRQLTTASLIATAWCSFWVFHVAFFVLKFLIEFEMWLDWDSMPDRGDTPIPSVDPAVDLVLMWLMPGLIASAFTLSERKRVRGSNPQEQDLRITLLLAIGWPLSAVAVLLWLVAIA